MAASTSLTIGGVTFACLPISQADFRDVAAVYVVICVREDRSWTVVDVGQSGEVGTRIDSHDRQGCWARNCPGGNLWVCVYPMPSAQYSKQNRLDFEAGLRRQYDPRCGEI